jgi:hypothetical protein
MQYANQSALEHQTGPTVRPMQGLQANKHGSSLKMQLGDELKTILDVRSETNDAEMLSVSIGVVQLDPGQPFFGVTVDLVARVTWGMGGANFETEMDLINGLTFAIPATYLRIDVSYRGSGPLAAAPTFQVSAGAGYGTHVSNSSPTRRTVRLGYIPHAGFASVVIPFFATSFALFAWDPALTANLFVEVRDRNLTPVQKYSLTSYSNLANQNEIAYPIANGTYDLNISHSAAGSIPVGVIFNLNI